LTAAGVSPLTTWSMNVANVASRKTGTTITTARQSERSSEELTRVAVWRRGASATTAAPASAARTALTAGPLGG